MNSTAKTLSTLGVMALLAALSMNPACAAPVAPTPTPSPTSTDAPAPVAPVAPTPVAPTPVATAAPAPIAPTPIYTTAPTQRPVRAGGGCMAPGSDVSGVPVGTPINYCQTTPAAVPTPAPVVPVATPAPVTPMKTAQPLIDTGFAPASDGNNDDAAGLLLALGLLGVVGGGTVSMVVSRRKANRNNG